MRKQEIDLKQEGTPRELYPYEHHAKYYETDQTGTIHHSNYVKWMEEARMDLLSQIGLGYKQMEELEIISPVISISVDFISIVHFDDTIVIETHLVKYDGLKMELEYVMYDKKTGDRRATGRSCHCFLTRTGRPVSLKRMYPELDTKFFEFKENN